MQAEAETASPALYLGKRPCCPPSAPLGGNFSSHVVKAMCGLFFMLAPMHASAMSAAANDAAVDSALSGMFGTKSDSGGDDDD